MSPSSRRAWIEIVVIGFYIANEGVALLAEGVDRNADASNAPGATGRSPSSRRVWIEKVPPKYKVPLPIL